MAKGQNNSGFWAEVIKAVGTALIAIVVALIKK
jgi:hypothetical protein